MAWETDFKEYHGTMPRIYWELMLASTVRKRYCCVCGMNNPLNQHHIVPRSRGNLVDPHGMELVKPTVTLCGNGNASGCHKLAHSGMLHFRWFPKDARNVFGDPMGMQGLGRLHYLITDEPTDYVEAYGMDWWQPIL